MARPPPPLLIELSVVETELSTPVTVALSPMATAPPLMLTVVLVIRSLSLFRPVRRSVVFSALPPELCRL